MRVTDIIKPCSNCSKELRLFSDDDANDMTICWNYCPHCGAKNEVWIRFVNKANYLDTIIPVGIGCDLAHEMRDKQYREMKNKMVQGKQKK